jgi:hypothetical protein
MCSRGGNIDPAIVTYLLREEHTDPAHRWRVHVGLPRTRGSHDRWAAFFELCLSRPLLMCNRTGCLSVVAGLDSSHDGEDGSESDLIYVGRDSSLAP